MDVLIAGGNGGIGLALVKAILADKPDARVHATYRSHRPELQHPNLLWHPLNLTSEMQIAKLSETLPRLDWLINAAGLLHSQSHQPEKTVQSLEPGFFMENIQTNTLPTLLLAKHFQSALKHSDNSCFATISARVGSIGDNYLGGWISYRSSKAALNMALKTLSIEWKRTLPKCCVLALHPGTTDTHLSEPFQRNIPPERLFNPDKTASQLLCVLNDQSSARTGTFLSYDGTPLPW